MMVQWYRCWLRRLMLAGNKLWFVRRCPTFSAITGATAVWSMTMAAFQGRSHLRSLMILMISLPKRRFWRLVVVLSTNEYLVISTALQWLSKIFPAWIAEFIDLIRSLVDDIDSTRMAATEAEKEGKWQKGFVSVFKKSASDALNDMASFSKRVAVSDRHEKKLLANTSFVSSHIARTTA